MDVEKLFDVLNILMQDKDFANECLVLLTDYATDPEGFLQKPLILSDKGALFYTVLLDIGRQERIEKIISETGYTCPACCPNPDGREWGKWFPFAPMYSMKES